MYRGRWKVADVALSPFSTRLLPMLKTSPVAATIESERRLLFAREFAGVFARVVEGARARGDRSGRSQLARNRNVAVDRVQRREVGRYRGDVERARRASRNAGEDRRIRWSERRGGPDR